MKDCRKCKDKLNNDNWLPSCQKRNKYICSQCVKNDNNKRYQKRKGLYLDSSRKVRINIKQQVFEYYGGCCKVCNEKNFNKLSLDHINGNGRQHRKEVLGTDSGSAFYKWVLKNKPDNIRILCFNCNCKVYMTKQTLMPTNNVGCKYCGGEIYRNTICNKCWQIKKRNDYIDLKLEAFKYYGNKCAHCLEENIEFLTIDHINNDGAEHRKIIGTQIFPFLKHNNYPKDFQILCFNCNYMKRNEFLAENGRLCSPKNIKY